MRDRSSAVLLGDMDSGSSLKRNRVGTGTAAPNANTSLVPSDGTKLRRLVAASGAAARTILWSLSLLSRIVNNVLHWEMIVASSSAGLWVIRPRKTPYLRPSFAIREIALRVGPKPPPRSEGA